MTWVATSSSRVLEDDPTGQSARDNARDLMCLSEAYLSGLPLELGWQARNIRTHRCKPLRKLLRDDHHLPLAGKVVEQLAKMLEPFVLDGAPSGPGWKRQVGISAPELGRQARMIDALLARDSYATALRMMRKWVPGYRRNRRKDALLQEHGYLVLRFLAENLGTRLDAVLDEVLRALARRTGGA